MPGSKGAVVLDHSVPPNVTFENYRYYINILREAAGLEKLSFNWNIRSSSTTIRLAEAEQNGRVNKARVSIVMVKNYDYEEVHATVVKSLELIGGLAIKSLWFLGIINKGRWYFCRLLISTLLKCPHHLPLSIGLSVSGSHFQKVAEGYNNTPVPLSRQNG